MGDERSGSRERDLVLAPNEFAYILDETKGNVAVYVGPTKTSLANTDRPVIFDASTKRFVQCSLDQAIQRFPIAPEGWYLVLYNPAEDMKHPKTGTSNSLAELNIGRKVNLPGPVSFAMWPGQMVKVIQGHSLRSNQYLIVQVYDEEAARANWKKSVIKPQTTGTQETGGEKKEQDTVHKTEEQKDEASNPAVPTVTSDTQAPDLTMGQLIIIKGTDVSFYIPSTGIKVLKDERGSYVRDAVTLERLEYCILLDEDGNKRYIKGPRVVFPKPTETFVQVNNSRKFKAIELNEISGLYIKVIAAYEEDGNNYKVGDELFITGKEQMIYFPRPEHSIIKYGDQTVHYAVAIPAGEGRYVLDRLSGEIKLVNGPKMFLPDPRKEVIVRRVLSQQLVSMLYPGNQEAQMHNDQLRQLAEAKSQSGKADMVTDRDLRKSLSDITMGAAKSFQAGDEFTRGTSFTPPRTITLDTKYDGAITINVWTGYAILVVSKTGARKVHVGPCTVLLQYDETPEIMELSTGTPKSDDHLMRTAYLRVENNKVSDVVMAETADFVGVKIRVSYRVNFEGENDKWFNVENYVKFLTEHMRSLIRNMVKQHGIEEFYNKSIAMVRDTVLGQPSEGSKRPGRSFEENGMRIYDVEVLDVIIDDPDISRLLATAQHVAVEQAITLVGKKRELEVIKQTEKITQEIKRAQAETGEVDLDLQVARTSQLLTLNLAKVKADADTETAELAAEQEKQAVLDKISAAELARNKAEEDQELALAKERMLCQ